MSGTDAILREFTTGASVPFTSGPFPHPTTGAAIDFTAGGWTLTLHLYPPGGPSTPQTGTVTGDANGNLTYLSEADEITECDVWAAKFEATDGTLKLYSKLTRFRITPVVP